MKIKLEEVATNVWFLHFENQYKCCSTMMRLQEFYESPLRGIRGQYFTLEQFMDAYAKAHGNFTYTSDWGGFNVPGHIVRKFFYEYSEEGALLDKEMELRDVLEHLLDDDGKFYLIAAYERDQRDQRRTFYHEMAHAFYYLDPEYRKDMKKLESKLSKKQKNQIFKVLQEHGYSKRVYSDELQAYLATGPIKDMNVTNKMGKPFMERFKTRYKLADKP